MKNKGFEVGVIVFLIVFSLIIFGLYLVYDLYMNTKSYTLILKPYTVLECKKWDCKNFSNDFDKYNKKDYNIYINGKNVGVNLLTYNKVTQKFHIYDKNNNSVYNDGSLFGVTGKAKVDGISYNLNELTEDEINYIKNKNNLKFDIMDALYTSKVALDFDNDGENETIYQLSSSLDAQDAPLYFDYVFYEDNDKFYEIINDTSENNNFENVGLSRIVNVLDIFNDNKLEFVISTEKPLTGGNCSVIYRLKGKKYVQVNECEVK